MADAPVGLAATIIAVYLYDSKAVPEPQWLHTHHSSLHCRTRRWVMKPALFWVITQRIAVIPYWSFGTTYQSYLQGSRIFFGFLKMVPISCLKMLVINYHYSLSNNTEECSCHLLCGRSPKSRVGVW